jgi:hypothetical protein
VECVLVMASKGTALREVPLGMKAEALRLELTAANAGRGGAAFVPMKCLRMAQLGCCFALTICAEAVNVCCILHNFLSLR